MKSDTVKIAQASKKKKTTTFLYSTTQEAETMKGTKHEKRYRGNIFHLIEQVKYLAYSDVDVCYMLCRT